MASEISENSHGKVSNAEITVNIYSEVIDVVQNTVSPSPTQPTAQPFPTAPTGHPQHGSTSLQLALPTSQPTKLCQDPPSQPISRGSLSPAPSLCTPRPSSGPEIIRVRSRSKTTPGNLDSIYTSNSGINSGLTKFYSCPNFTDLNYSAAQTNH